jgi:hypothetical protein
LLGWRLSKTTKEAGSKKLNDLMKITYLPNGLVRTTPLFPFPVEPYSLISFKSLKPVVV